ncbi:MAG: pilus assembly protein PilP [Syntrophales bacterium]|jgi:type IV pilus assembly protein PilP
MEKNRLPFRIMRILLASAAVLWLSSSTSIAAVPQSAETKASGADVAETKTPDVKTAPAYKYNPVGKPDPFKPFIEQEVGPKKIERKPLPISPLQREGIEQFRLVGISGDNHRRIAIVQNVKGKAYTIFLGTYIGLNGGRVVEILPDRIIIEEKSKAEDKQAKAKRLTMKLRKDEGEE